MPKKEMPHSSHFDPVFPDIVIGPSQAQRLKDQKEALENEMNQVKLEIGRRRSAEQIFKEEYGDDLGDLAIST